MTAKISLFLSGLVVVLLAGVSYADSIPGTADGYGLQEVFRRMYQAEPAADSARQITNYTLAYPDFSLILQDGAIIPFEPVPLDSHQTYFAAYFEGDAVLQFAPPVDFERGQLHRFYDTDTLNRPITSALLLFGPGIWDYIRHNSRPSSDRMSKGDVRQAKDRWEDLTADENHLFVFRCLESHVHTSERPFLLVDCEPDDAERTYYVYNPGLREEVTLYREDRAPGRDYMELVNSYTEDISGSYESISGVSKARVAAIHYDLDGAIDRKGEYFGSAKAHFEVVRAPLRTLKLNLHRKLKVDSVRMETGDSVAFVRYEDESNESLDLFLFFDRGAFSWGDTVSLIFYYAGEIAKANLGIFDVSAGGAWYPHATYHQHSTFDMKFRTPIEYTFVAVGDEVAQDTVGDTLLSHWRVDQPVANVSFCIGPVEKYEFEGRVPIDVYYSKDVHERISWARHGYRAGADDMQDEVAEDVIQSVRFFSKWYGPYSGDRLVVTEVFSDHGEAFPGFLHLGQHTWMRTDTWGRQRLFRAHEVAHQWWGVAVGYETYHDQWLSEAFAEYSAMLYYRQIESRERFEELLNEYRDEIFSIREYGFGFQGPEPSPIILGQRTHSSKTEGDYGAIVYRKGAWVLHMLKRMLNAGGEQTGVRQGDFMRIMRRFYEEYSGKKATTADFIRVVEEDVGQDMGWFFDQWIYRTDLPTIEIEWSKGQDRAGDWYVWGTVNVTGVDSTFRMPVPAAIQYKRGSLIPYPYHRGFEIRGTETEFRLAKLPAEPMSFSIDKYAVLCRIK